MGDKWDGLPESIRLPPFPLLSQPPISVLTHTSIPATLRRPRNES